MLWQRFFKLWQQLYTWERKYLIWYARLALADRALLPAMSYHAAAMAVVVFLEPEQPMLWSMAFVVSMVYSLMLRTVVSASSTWRARR